MSLESRNNRAILRDSVTRAGVVSEILDKIPPFEYRHHPEQEARINNVVSHQFELMEQYLQTGKEPNTYDELVSLREIFGDKAENLSITDFCQALGEGVYLMSAYYEGRLTSQRIFDSQKGQQGEYVECCDIFYFNSGKSRRAAEIRRGWDPDAKAVTEEVVIYTQPVDVDGVSFLPESRDNLPMIRFTQHAEDLAELSEINIREPLGETGLFEIQKDRILMDGALNKLCVVLENEAKTVEFNVRANTLQTDKFMVVRKMMNSQDYQWVLSRNNLKEARDLEAIIGIDGVINYPSGLIAYEVDLTDVNNPLVIIDGVTYGGEDVVKWGEVEDEEELDRLVVKLGGKTMIIFFNEYLEVEYDITEDGSQDFMHRNQLN